MDFNLDFSFIAERHKKLIAEMKDVWTEIGEDTLDPIWHLRQFAFPWAILAFVIGFLFKWTVYSVDVALTQAFSFPAITLLVIYGGAFILEKLANNYTPTSKNEFLIILNYASIPIFISHLFGGIFTIVSVFSLVILWYGFDTKVRVEENKKVGFFILAAIILFLLQTIATAIVMSLTRHGASSGLTFN